ncbi:UNVERIFIED_CONTAM: PRA1 family protein B4 [Sesamum calycinum]|uniref:PRA1 family protein n=1 Tax=Sesamum calycinum TaxID=2727403 RepID=A0AAW2LGD6_9LAMI
MELEPPRPRLGLGMEWIHRRRNQFPYCHTVFAKQTNFPIPWQQTPPPQSSQSPINPPPPSPPTPTNYLPPLPPSVPSSPASLKPSVQVLLTAAPGQSSSTAPPSPSLNPSLKLLRIRKNYSYFRINYLAVISAVLAVSLLTNPFSLILLAALLASWLFLYLFRQPSDPPLTVFGRQFSDRETLLFLIVSTIVVIFLTSVGSILVSAFMVGIGIVCLHGALRTPEDLFLDEQEAQGGSSGFLSFFTSGAPAVAQPPVAARA